MTRHISEQYDIELAQIRQRLMEMGGLVEQQVNRACQALTTHDMSLAEQVRDDESKLNQMEVDLDDQCVSIIAKRQPTAGDLRIVVSVMKVITDLERVGDEADRIANMALSIANSEIPADQYADYRDMSAKVGKSLNRALDAFARLDIESALRVIESDEAIDRAYNGMVRHCIEAMRDQPEQIENSISLIWAARALERIGDHSKNISEYVIYQVKGLDVRHSPSAELDTELDV
jgi:phosphate transport system protein